MRCPVCGNAHSLIPDWLTGRCYTCWKCGAWFPPDPCGHEIAPELVAEINAVIELDNERWNVIEWGEWL